MQKREDVIEGFRLSPLQKRVWRLQQDDQAHIAQCAILIEGDLEPEALEEALKKVMQKHEILRTTLDWFPGLEIPLQIILEDQRPPCRRVDLSDDQPDELEVDRLFNEEAQAFDLKGGLLTRFCLGRWSASKQILLITLHALCADSWTLRNLFKEIIHFYAAELDGQELWDQAVQYLQFSEWQNELLEEETVETADLDPEVRRPVSNLALPLELTSAGYSGTSRRRDLPETMSLILDTRSTERIKAISESHGSSVSNVLLACWQILLWRLSANEEIAIEYLFDGRQFDDLHDALGLFARPVPVRGAFGPDLRFSEAVERTMRSLQEASASQERWLREMADRKAEDRAEAIGFEFGEWPEASAAGAARFTY